MEVTGDEYIIESMMVNMVPSPAIWMQALPELWERFSVDGLVTYGTEVSTLAAEEFYRSLPP